MAKNKPCIKSSKQQLREWATILFFEGREDFLDATSHLPRDVFCFVLNDMNHLMNEEIVHLLAERKKGKEQEADDG